jgi:hypothetical protein
VCLVQRATVKGGVVGKPTGRGPGCPAGSLPSTCPAALFDPQLPAHVAVFYKPRV